MMTRTDVERIAAAINQLRPDWPVRQIATIVERKHTARSVMDVTLALTYVALDRIADGQLASRTPARVDEAGPWWEIAVHATTAGHDAERSRRELEERRAAHRARLAAIDACDLCEPTGYLTNGRVCDHDPHATVERAQLRAEPARTVLHDTLQRMRASMTSNVRPSHHTDGEPEFFTVVDNVLRGDGKGTHHAAIVGPGVLCGSRDHVVEAVAWEHGVSNVDCAACLEVLAREPARR